MISAQIPINYAIYSCNLLLQMLLEVFNARRSGLVAFLTFSQMEKRESREDVGGKGRKVTCMAETPLPLLTPQSPPVYPASWSLLFRSLLL